jgi:hypothetical protein
METAKGNGERAEQWPVSGAKAKRDNPNDEAEGGEENFLEGGETADDAVNALDDELPRRTSNCVVDAAGLLQRGVQPRSTDAV